MAVTELLDPGRSLDRDSNASAAARYFRVHDTPVDSAPNDPNLPPLNSVHPVHTNLFLDHYRWSLFGDGLSTLAIAEYSSDGRFRSPPYRDPRDATYQPFSISPQKVTWDLPFAYKVRRVVDGVTTPIDTWRIDARPITETRTIFSCRVVMPTLTFSDLNAILGQNGHLHNLGNAGKLYLFECGAITPIEGENVVWEAQYQWTLDTGTVTPGEQGFDPNTIVFPDGGYGDWQAQGDYIRPPYSEIVPIPALDAESQPTFGLVFPYVTDPNGYLVLPGDPPV